MCSLLIVNTRFHSSSVCFLASVFKQESLFDSLTKASDRHPIDGSRRKTNSCRRVTAVDFTETGGKSTTALHKMCLVTNCEAITEKEEIDSYLRVCRSVWTGRLEGWRVNDFSEEWCPSWRDRSYMDEVIIRLGMWAALALDTGGSMTILWPWWRL